jgi:hypothetical protein
MLEFRDLRTSKKGIGIRARLVGRASVRSTSHKIDVNGVRIHARDGAAITDVGIVTITAIDDADLVMVDVL